MAPKLPNDLEPRVADALVEGSCSLFTPDDIQTFLNEVKTDKPRTDRIIAYMARLLLITGHRKNWIQDICRAVSKYDFSALVSVRFTEIWDTDSGPARDIAGTGFASLERVCRFIGDDYVTGFYVIAHRFLHLLDGFGPPEVSEAIAGVLTRAFVSCIPARRMLTQPTKLAQHFQRIDGALREEARGWQNSLSFGLHLELYLFANNHPIEVVFTIWDAVLSHLFEVSQFSQALFVAHMRQIPSGGDPKVWREFDVVRLVEDATRISTHQRSAWQQCIAYGCPALFKRWQGYELADDW